MSEAELPNSRAGSSSASRQASAPAVSVPSLPEIFAAGKDFHLKEYESLKKEIADLVEHSHKLEIYALGGIAAFYAWFFHETARPDRIVLCIPILLVILGAFRSWAVLKRIYEIAEYLLNVEKVFSLKEPRLTGWETHREPKSSSPFLSSAAVFWAVLLAVTMLATRVL
jgi:hypothetical protein